MTSRGAGSVTLDTIIANAIRSAWVAPKIPNDANQLAAVVTDALLAKGHLEPREVYSPGGLRRSITGLWLPLDEYSLRGEPQTPTHQPPRGAQCN